jgi:glycosyltransferase involved in cell wall biosynthesis
MISVTVPICNEAGTLPELHRRILGALEELGRPWELILINDGSTDASEEILDDLAEHDPRVKVVHFRRNFGQTAAMMAGFDFAKGDVIIPLDGDLQNDPADIPVLLAKLDEGFDVVSGWRKDRQDRTVSRKLPSTAANAVISRVTGVRLHDYGCALKLYRADVIRGLRLYGELHRFIPALAAEVGANIIEVPVRHHARTRGVSKYGIDRTFRVLLDLLWIKFLMRFLHRPLQAFGGVGLALGAAGFLILAYLTYEKLALGAEIGGRPLLLLGVLLALIGVQLVATGLIGELLTRIYHEPQGRPQYLLRRQPRKGS